MNCDEIREKISCMLDSQLSAEDSAVVTEHLSHCPECSRMYQAFQAISVSMAQLEDVPDGFTESVMKNLSQSTPKHKHHSRFAYFTSLAACLALVIFAGSRLSTAIKPAPEADNTASKPRIESQIDAAAQVTPNQTVVDPVAPDLENTDTSADTDTDVPEEDLPETFALDPKSVEPMKPVSVQQGTPVEPTPAPEKLTHSRTLADLLVRVEMADINLYRTAPDAEVTVQDKDGLTHMLEIWYETSRIYCKDNTIREAYYAPIAPSELADLLKEDHQP